MADRRRLTKARDDFRSASRLARSTAVTLCSKTKINVNLDDVISILAPVTVGHPSLQAPSQEEAASQAFRGESGLGWVWNVERRGQRIER